MVQVIVKDSQGKILCEFSGNSKDSLSSQLQENGAFVPVACGVGACGICKLTVKKGIQFLEPEKFGKKAIQTQENEVFSCVSGIREDTPKDEIIELKCDNL